MALINSTMIEMNVQHRVLIVDNDKDYSERISNILREDGYTIYLANSGSIVLDQAKKVHPHIILLEVGIPDIDGIELCQIIRETPELSSTVVVFLTNQAEDFIQIAAFKAGCDDFILKTIKPRVFAYRVHALLKRQIEKENDLSVNESINSGGKFLIDPERFVVVVDSKNIYLPKKQFLLLQLLASKPSKVFTRNSIFDFLWGHNSKVGARTIDVYIRKIREQIGIKYIKTIKGVGYRFNSSML